MSDDANDLCLSTGSTLLNLALTNDPFGGLLVGKYYFLVGDSTAGKTFLAVSCLAEAAMDDRFDDYRLIYDNIEDGCLLDLERLFNSEVAGRIEPPAADTTNAPVYSSTVEEFYFNLDDVLSAGDPVIYVLDSMDGLTTKAAEERFEDDKKAHRAGKDAGGSYAVEKAKINSERLRKVLNKIRSTGSILLILSQTRDNISSGWGGKTRSGGHALRFYATVEMWMKVVKKLKKRVGGKEREVGVRVQAGVKKNRITGLLQQVEFDIFPSYGIDDLGSVVDYLVEEGVWMGGGQKGGRIEAPALDLSGRRDKIIGDIESRGIEDKIYKLAGECWNEVLKKCALDRKSRY